MRVLFDTECFLFWHFAVANLNESVLNLIKNPDNEVYLSAASSWEIGIKAQIGKLALPMPLKKLINESLQRDGFLPLPIEQAHTIQVTNLPLHHKDPFDRILIAQAQVDSLSLVTTDRILFGYNKTKLIWAGSGHAPR